MYFIYNVILKIAGIIAAPYFLFKMLTDTRYRSGLNERLGYPAIEEKRKLRLLVHASSVGEVNIAHPFIKKLKKEFQDTEIIITSMTPEGYALAREKLKGLASAFYFCLDYKSAVRNFLDRILPDVVFIMETEIWPNFLRETKRRGIKTAVINGRISERSFKRYMRIKGFIKSALKNIDLFLVQREVYKERLFELIGGDGNIKVTGNIKFDIDDSYFNIDEELLESVSGFDYILAASTHEGEEKKLISILPGIKEEFKDIKLIIAPRHIQRCGSIETKIADAGFSHIKRNELVAMKSVPDCDIILIDTIGDLITLFERAKIVFMGGSLVNIGGHNIIEPAYLKKPVIFGPNMQNFDDAKELIMGEGGAVMVKDEHELKDKIIHLLKNEDELIRIGENARNALDKERGTLENTINEIRTFSRFF